MSNLFYVVLIVAVVIIGDTMQKDFKMKMQERETDPELEKTLAHIEALEERIRVLERIVTENKFDLKNEIDRLE